MALQQLFKSLKVRLCGSKIDLDRRHVAVRGRNLRLRLPDVFRARSSPQQAKPGIGGRSIGLPPLQREIHVARIELGDHITLLCPIAFGDENVEHAPADLRRHLHFGGFDLT